MSWFSVIAPYLGGILGYSSAASSRKAANQAGDVAAGLSQEQEALLRLMREREEQYGAPMLEQMWEWANQPPGESPYDKWRYARGAERIGQAYQPAYSQALQNLSGRHMLMEPSSQAGQMMSGLDRARAGTVSDWAMSFHDPDEQARRLAMFADLLSQRGSQQMGLTQAYESPISRYAGLAQQTAAGMYDPLSALIALLTQQQLGQKKAPSGATSGAQPGPFVSTAPSLTPMHLSL